MSGHVFVIQADLTALACDAWLVPTDVNLTVEAPWRGHIATPLPATPDGWSNNGIRVMAGHPASPGGPTPWLVNVGGIGNEGTDWYLDGVRGFLETFAATAADLPRNGRSRHLVALPVVGTGKGGAWDVKGEITKALIDCLLSEAERADFDIALVTWTSHAFTAAQAARRRISAARGIRMVWPELDNGLVAHAQRLAADARAGRLVVFLGAGTGVCAGVPLWTELLAALAEDAGMNEEKRSRLAALPDPLDQAKVIERRLGTDSSVGRAIAARLKPITRYGLVHCLLSSLPVTEFATTNYDDLFERAYRSCGDTTRRTLAVLPYEPTRDRNAWLLKMHGSVDRPNDIVLTRDDYLGYAEKRAALKGIVQALLITRHMLFVGFSLSDPNFHQVVHDVRRALGGLAATAGPFGTALALAPDEMLEELWQGDLTLVAMGEQETTPDLARRLEILLDLILANATSVSSHLLDETYAGLLDEPERELREALVRLQGIGAGAAGRTQAWESVDRLLRELGAGGPGTC